MAHLFFSRFFAPQSRLTLRAARHRPEAVTADLFSGVVAHHAQCFVDGIVAHALVLVVFAGENKCQMPGERFSLLQDRNRLPGQWNNVLCFHLCATVREAHVFDLLPFFRNYP